MKNIKILFVSMLAAVFSGCMDNHDDPVDYIYGNAIVGEANTSIAELKSKYASVVSSNKVEEVQEDIVISGVVVGDDESGNIYKNLYINDGTGTLVIGVNATGLYAYLPVGQKIAVNCKGLYMGGYGSMAQLGSLYQGKIGRMPEYTWKEHVKPVGQPDLSYPELIPMEIDEAWLSSANKADAAFFVKVKDATFEEADGHTQYAPEDKGDAGNGVDRTLKIGNTGITFRTSTYANFATNYMKMGKVDVTGLLTQYNGKWQFTVRTLRDIQ